jgi:FixJ family two-component response regulator
MEGRMNRLDNSSLVATPATTIGLLGPSKRFNAAAQTKLDAPIVYIGGDIPGAAEAIQEAGWRIQKLDSLDDLFDGAEPETASCLLIDLAWSSLENRALQQRLAGLGAQVPFICTAQEVNLAMVVAIMRPAHSTSWVGR